jgi:hypothetical protein
MKVHASQSTNYIQSFKKIVIFTLHYFWSGYVAKYLELDPKFHSGRVSDPMFGVIGFTK